MQTAPDVGRIRGDTGSCERRHHEPDEQRRQRAFANLWRDCSMRTYSGVGLKRIGSVLGRAQNL
jgi:hypothetical protein